MCLKLIGILELETYLLHTQTQLENETQCEGFAEEERERKSVLSKQDAYEEKGKGDIA